MARLALEAVSRATGLCDWTFSDVHERVRLAAEADGTVTREKFDAAVASMLPPGKVVGAEGLRYLKDTLAPLYDLCDLDRDGSVGSANLAAGLAVLCHGPIAAACPLTRLSDAIDDSDDEGEHERRTVDGHASAVGSKGVASGPLQKVCHVFDVFDADHDGRVSEGELRTFLTAFFRVARHYSSLREGGGGTRLATGADPSALSAATTMAQECFHKFDINHNGTLSMSEFCEWYRQFGDELSDDCVNVDKIANLDNSDINTGAVGAVGGGPPKGGDLTPKSLRSDAPPPTQTCGSRINDERTATELTAGGGRDDDDDHDCADIAAKGAVGCAKAESDVEHNEDGGEHGGANSDGDADADADADDDDGNDNGEDEDALGHLLWHRTDSDPATIASLAHDRTDRGRRKWRQVIRRLVPRAWRHCLWSKAHIIHPLHESFRTLCARRRVGGASADAAGVELADIATAIVELLGAITATTIEGKEGDGEEGGGMSDSPFILTIAQCCKLGALFDDASQPTRTHDSRAAGPRDDQGADRERTRMIKSADDLVRLVQFVMAASCAAAYDTSLRRRDGHDRQRAVQCATAHTAAGQTEPTQEPLPLATATSWDGGGLLPYCPIPLSPPGAHRRPSQRDDSFTWDGGGLMPYCMPAPEHVPEHSPPSNENGEDHSPPRAETREPKAATQNANDSPMLTPRRPSRARPVPATRARTTLAAPSDPSRSKTGEANQARRDEDIDDILGMVSLYLARLNHTADRSTSGALDQGNVSVQMRCCEIKQLLTKTRHARFASWLAQTHCTHLLESVRLERSELEHLLNAFESHTPPRKRGAAASRPPASPAQTMTTKLRAALRTERETEQWDFAARATRLSGSPQSDAYSPYALAMTPGMPPPQRRRRTKPRRNGDGGATRAGAFGSGSGGGIAKVAARVLRPKRAGGIATYPNGDRSNGVGLGRVSVGDGGEYDEHEDEHCEEGVGRFDDGDDDIAVEDPRFGL